jgi:hypothetical protein
MIRWGAAGLLLLAAGAAQPAPGPRPVQYAQTIVRQQVVIRVRQTAPEAAISWKEGKGFKCVPARAILGATLLGQRSVDLILKDRSRVRASLESRCPALDYYQGFYITPGPDGMICADRDIVRSRVGGACEIERFRTLEAVQRR